jgi:hypothetical protein
MDYERLARLPDQFAELDFSEALLRLDENKTSVPECGFRSPHSFEGGSREVTLGLGDDL